MIGSIHAMAIALAVSPRWHDGAADDPQQRDGAAAPTVTQQGDARASQAAGGIAPDIVVTAREHHAPGDPMEAMNVKAFAATQAVDTAFIRPVAMAYKHAVPSPLRTGIRHVLRNLHEPVIALNYLVQFKPGKATETVGRFAINSTVGVAGIFDVAKAKPFHLPFRPNGFADTLGYYGVKPGAFLFLPLLGPTTVRDLIGEGLDRLVLPLGVGKPFNKLGYTIPVTVLRALDHRAEFDEQLETLHRTMPNPYAASREFYLESRAAEIEALHHRKTKPREIPAIAPAS